MAALSFTYQVNGFIHDPCLIKTLLAPWDVLGIDIRAAFRTALKYCRYFSYSGAQLPHPVLMYGFFPPPYQVIIGNQLGVLQFN